MNGESNIGIDSIQQSKRLSCGSTAERRNGTKAMSKETMFGICKSFIDFIHFFHFGNTRFPLQFSDGTALSSMHGTKTYNEWIRYRESLIDLRLKIKFDRSIRNSRIWNQQEITKLGGSFLICLRSKLLIRVKRRRAVEWMFDYWRRISKLTWTKSAPCTVILI